MGAKFASEKEALAEAHAIIGRQQVMLDRALEASFDDKARADRAEAALRAMADGPTYTESVDVWIARIVRDARAALSSPHATKG